VRTRVLEAMPLTALLGAAAGLYASTLHARTNYDEGVYLASLDALRHGQALGTGVFASQPPGFYVLLQGMGFVLTDSVAGIRVGFLLVALVGLAAAYAVGRKVAGLPGGIAAAALLAVTAPYPAQSFRVQADTTSVVLALGAIAVLMHAGRRFWPAVAAGMLAGAAVSVKLLAAPVVVPLAVLLIARRSRGQAAGLVGAAVVVVAALVGRYAYALSELYDGVIAEHRRARSIGPGLGSNAHRVLLHAIDWPTPAGVLVPIGLVGCILFCRRAETLALAAWIVSSALVLIYQKPLLDHHMVLIASALAVTGGVGLGAAVARLPRPGRLAAGAIACLALAAGFVQEHRRLARDDVPEPPGVRWAARQLDSRTRPGELVGTDLPIVAYLARRPIPGQLVDTSFVRLQTQSLTTRKILDELERKRVRAVVVAREFREKPDLLAALGVRYPTRIRDDGVTLYLRSGS
jgi:Dolichyl-phosphate-mannose-protein mannosyltransferase